MKYEAAAREACLLCEGEGEVYTGKPADPDTCDDFMPCPQCAKTLLALEAADRAAVERCARIATECQTAPFLEALPESEWLELFRGTP